VIRTNIPIQRTAEGWWKAGPCSICIDAARPIPFSGVRQDEQLEDLVETLMGEALLALDKHGRRGTSESIQWEITVDGAPYCYRCVAPMQKVSASSDSSVVPKGADWTCAQCGTAIRVVP
jgi:hypothetical protein